MKPPGQLRDIRMIQKAMEQRWDIKPEYKDALIRRLVRIIADPTSTPREVTSASRALIAAEGQNQTDDRDNMEADESRNRFLDIAARLGIAGSSGRIADRRTEDDPGSVDWRTSPIVEGRKAEPAGEDGIQAGGDS